MKFSIGEIVKIQESYFEYTGQSQPYHYAFQEVVFPSSGSNNLWNVVLHEELEEKEILDMIERNEFQILSSEEKAKVMLQQA
jgi:hypothetical protein